MENVSSAISKCAYLHPCSVGADVGSAHFEGSIDRSSNILIPIIIILIINLIIMIFIILI